MTITCKKCGLSTIGPSPSPPNLIIILFQLSLLGPLMNIIPEILKPYASRATIAYLGPVLGLGALALLVVLNLAGPRWWSIFLRRKERCPECGSRHWKYGA